MTTTCVTPGSRRRTTTTSDRRRRLKVSWLTDDPGGVVVASRDLFWPNDDEGPSSSSHLPVFLARPVACELHYITLHYIVVTCPCSSLEPAFGFAVRSALRVFARLVPVVPSPMLLAALPEVPSPGRRAGGSDPPCARATSRARRSASPRREISAARAASLRLSKRCQIHPPSPRFTTSFAETQQQMTCAPPPSRLAASSPRLSKRCHTQTPPLLVSPLPSP